MRIPFVGPTYSLESAPASVQRTVNMVPVPLEPGNERTAWVFKDVPGLVNVNAFLQSGTVLFLFHMTDSASGEGITEFVAIYDIVDQTGAVWTNDQPSWQLAVADPDPKFGMASLTSDGSVTIERNTTQADPVPSEFSVGGITTLQLDTWVYIDSAVLGPVTFEVGANAYPFPATFFLTIETGGGVFFGFEDASEDSQGLTSGSIPVDTWTHVRLLCVGNEIRVYLDGVADSTVVTTESADPIGEMLAMNLFRVTLGDGGMFLDDARGLLGGPASTANFTAPVVPWPNP